MFISVFKKLEYSQVEAYQFRKRVLVVSDAVIKATTEEIKMVDERKNLIENTIRQNKMERICNQLLV